MNIINQQTIDNEQKAKLYTLRNCAVKISAVCY